MDRIWQWAWDRYGARYTWALCVIAFLVSLWVYLFLLSFPIVAFEKSDHYVEAAAVTVVAVPVLVCIMVLPGRRFIRPVEKWAAGHEVDRATALKGTYSYARRAVPQTVWGTGVWAAVLSIVVGAIAGATWSRLVQYGILGAVFGTAVQLIAFHSIVEAIWRPPESPSPVTPGSVIHCRGPVQLSPRVRTYPWLRSRSRSPLVAPCWRPCWIRSVKYLSSRSSSDLR